MPEPSPRPRQPLAACAFRCETGRHRRPRPHRGPPGLLATAWVLLPLALLAAACGRDAGTAAERPNLVLVVVDTLRADHLGAYGYDRPTSPAFDRLAADSVLFLQARAQAPCTFPSVNSLLTSQPVWRFSGRPPGHLGIPAELATVAGRLRRAGYRTAAVSASPVVRRAPGAINREGGFGAGFDLFLDGCTWQDGRCVGRRARSLLGLLDEPFFLYLHYLDPHDPYAPPAVPGRRRFASPWSGDPAVAAGDPLPAAARLHARGDAGLSPAAVAHLEDLYDEEIAWFDRLLADLLTDLDRRGLRDRTLLVVTADHGESFLEHGQLRHCRSLYDEELRVPLLVRLPAALGAPRPQRIDRPVALLNVAPTLLDYAGVDLRHLAPPALAGRSLRPWLEASNAGDSARPRPVAASAGTGRTLLAGRFKLHYDLADGTTRLYDVLADPGETHDLAPLRPALTTRLLTRLDRRLRRIEGEGLQATSTRLDRSREAHQDLKALGYLQ